MSDLGRPFGEDFDLRRKLTTGLRRIDELERLLGLVPTVQPAGATEGTFPFFVFPGGGGVAGAATLADSPVRRTTRPNAAGDALDVGVTVNGYEEVIGDLTVTGKVLPDEDNYREIGSPLLAWTNGYIRAVIGNHTLTLAAAPDGLAFPLTPSIILDAAGMQIVFEGGPLVPNMDFAWDLGENSTPLRWNNLYVGNVQCATINGAAPATGTVTGSGTDNQIPLWTDGAAGALGDSPIAFDGISKVTLQNVNLEFDSGGITKLYGITTQGIGIPAITDTKSLVNNGADIGSTDLLSADVVGLYRVSYYLEDTVADLTAGTVTVSISWVDSSGTTRTTTSAAVALTLISTGQASATLFIQLGSGAISYSTSHTGIFGTAKYSLFLICERLS